MIKYNQYVRILILIFLGSAGMLFPWKQLIGTRISEEMNEKKYVCSLCKHHLSSEVLYMQHIIQRHYACPWCTTLEYFEASKWKYATKGTLSIRVKHIQSCALENKTSLWHCKTCLAIFYCKPSRHLCGERSLINIACERTRNTYDEKDHLHCRFCPGEKSLSCYKSLKNHYVSMHATCPWCLQHFSNKNSATLRYRQLTEKEKSAACAHLIFCSSLYGDEESLSICHLCYWIGYKVSPNSSTHHLIKDCVGVVCRGCTHNDCFKGDLTEDDKRVAEIFKLLGE